jgi:hypothetical protein
MKTILDAVIDKEDITSGPRGDVGVGAMHHVAVKQNNRT